MKAPQENTQEPQKETVQRVQQESSSGGEATIADNRPTIAIQRKLRSAMGGAEDTSNPIPIQRKTNNTGLPNTLKSGIENLSRYRMDDVKVHYNSSKPAQLQAHAYAQGTDIHIAPGQEKHLPHEAWHVVQQKQGRVKPTRQLKSKVNINDDAGLEREADVMGERALSLRKRSSQLHMQKKASVPIQRKVIQRQTLDEFIKWFDDRIPENDSDVDSGAREIREFNVPEFIKFQLDLDTEGKNVVTMGPEFEFAKVDPSAIMENLPIHEELLKSSEKVSGLPFVFETDAGNVIEAAFPPFIIGTVEEDFKVLAYRAMRITSQIEKYLKGMAEGLASEGKKLVDLKKKISTELGITLLAGESNYLKFSQMPLLRFTKGIGMFTNEYITRDEVTNAQINITMSLDDLGTALDGAVETNRGKEHMKRKVATTDWLAGKLIENNKVDVSILGYYISQIPLMALQNLMVKAREYNTDRDVFKESSSTNEDLLVKLSSVKDFMGFWVKAGLNDLIRLNPTLKDAILKIEKEDLINFLLEDEKFNESNLWEEHGNALVRFAKHQGIGTINENSFSEMVRTIVNGMFEMCENELPIKSVDILPDKDKGQNTDSYTNFSKEAGIFTNNENKQKSYAAPFMTRPDTHVSVPGDRFLVEVRGLNKGVLSNKDMHMFYMPGFRMKNEIEDWNSSDFTNHFEDSKTVVEGQGYRTFDALIDNEAKTITVTYTDEDGLNINDGDKKTNYSRNKIDKYDMDDVYIIKGTEFEDFPEVSFIGKRIKIHKSRVDRFVLFVKETINRSWVNKSFKSKLKKGVVDFRAKCTSNYLRVEVFSKKENKWLLRHEKRGIDDSYTRNIQFPVTSRFPIITFSGSKAKLRTTRSNAIKFNNFVKSRLSKSRV